MSRAPRGRDVLAAPGRAGRCRKQLFLGASKRGSSHLGQHRESEVLEMPRQIWGLETGEGQWLSSPRGLARQAELDTERALRITHPNSQRRLER